ncbi:hypothetical protein MHC_01435 [Mycoplasma haemocanis str. Illinois]|uniref:Uncharacterized protein n=1 Tax=Mycoplasma haemocanis (strain Illinois) TaxID=1111676 RepID=H6N681_MYCHN|nr:hypothetical protein [Mycoplasma haemocanis]AEW45153.1 hypothetical protein MHC_01435 [Mycoplasma haemocanis str. Illinois]
MNYLYILAGTGAVGAIGGGIYLAYPHSPTFRSKSIEDKLRQEYFVPITEDSAWQTMLTKYNEKKNEARFTSEKVDVKLEDLKSSCKKALSENADTSENYKKSRRWCTIPKTLSSLLEAHKLNLLNTGDGSENQQEWDKLQKSYEKASENRIDGLDLGSDGDKWKKLREKCKEISQKDSTEENFETLFSNLKRWCTKEESDKLTQ